VVDMLAIMIERTKSDIQIEGVIHNLVDGGLSILQYVDDTIHFMEHDMQKGRNLKFILSVFKQFLGLKINLHKSELFCFGDAQDQVDLYVELFGSQQRQFPIGYLGVPIHYRRIINAEWKMVEDKLKIILCS
jgi:hypothetical protein